VSARAEVLLLPASVGERLLAWTSWGYLDLKIDTRDGVLAVVGYSDRRSLRLPYDSSWMQRHYLRHADLFSGGGVWYRSGDEVFAMHRYLLLRSASIATETLAKTILVGWRHPPPDSYMLVVTVSYTEDGPLWTAWYVNANTAVPVEVQIVEDQRDPLDFLANEWPVEEFAQLVVTVVGVGSIGSVAVELLAAAGVGRLALVDPDRLEQRNLARHRLTDADLGRFKVHAVHDRIADSGRHTVVDAYPLDVIIDADVMRPIFASSHVIICTVDGVAPRRTANHLARRAGIPIVFAAVLEDGAFGELLRVRNRTGCLLCHRRALTDADTFDPEPGLDLGYGTGTWHRPMTAAPGDLALMGDFAAKAALATLLEARGRWNQRLPGDWMLIGLQPIPDMPPPFDIAEAGDVRWHELPDRRSDCPTCTPP
jgi:hypothetical protein